MSFSLQLYSMRSVPSLVELLPQIAEMGITRVEGFGAVYEDPAGYRTAMDQNGITMPSGHIGIPDIDADKEGVIAKAKILGVKKFFVPYLADELRPTTAKGYAAFANKLVTYAKDFAEHGIVLGWHNHDFEFEPLSDGSIPMKVMLDAEPTLAWEADLGWLVRAGEDGYEWLDRYGAQLHAIHVKDLAPSGENLNEDGWAALGEGTIDWAGLIAASKMANPDVIIILEHDNPSDAMRYARVSATNMKSILERLNG